MAAVAIAPYIIRWGPDGLVATPRYPAGSVVLAGLILGGRQSKHGPDSFGVALGGHCYDTWRRGGYRTPWGADETFWPRWLARDCPTLAVHVIGGVALARGRHRAPGVTLPKQPP